MYIAEEINDYMFLNLIIIDENSDLIFVNELCPYNNKLPQ